MSEGAINRDTNMILTHVPPTEYSIRGILLGRHYMGNVTKDNSPSVTFVLII